MTSGHEAWCTPSLFGDISVSILYSVIILTPLYIHPGGEGELTEIEVGQFPEQCLHIAHLILKQKQSLLPRSILKRCSVRLKTAEPIVVMPLELTCTNQGDEVMEWMTNV